jgi:Flp pilus assembly protein TadG
MVFRHPSASWTVAMFEFTRRKIATRMRRLVSGRRLRRFARRQDGVAAIEFAFIAAPFLALLFAILETSLVFFAGQTLEAAVADSARLIMTGQAQTSVSPTTSTVGYTQQDFKDAVCARVYGLFDCTNKLYVDVRTYSNFASVDESAPVTNKQFVSTNLKYTPGSAGDIVVVTLYYSWPINVTFLDSNLANLSNGTRLLVATSVFRNEPYN